VIWCGAREGVAAHWQARTHTQADSKATAKCAHGCGALRISVRCRVSRFLPATPPRLSGASPFASHRTASRRPGSTGLGHCTHRHTRSAGASSIGCMLHCEQRCMNTSKMPFLRFFDSTRGSPTKTACTHLALGQPALLYPWSSSATAIAYCRHLLADDSTIRKIP